MKSHAHTGRVMAAPAPRAAAAGKARQTTKQEPAVAEQASREDTIRRLAYERYLRNGRVDGRALDDWLAAEQSVCSMDARDEGRDETATPGP